MRPLQRQREWIRVALPILVLVTLAAGFYVLERQRDEQRLSESIRLTEALDGEAVSVTFLEPTVTHRQLEYIRRYRKIRRLNFKETTSLEGGLESLLDFKELTTIDLSETAWLDETAMSVVADATNISSLALNGSNISDSGMAALTAHPALRFLHLGGCSGVSDQSIDTLISLSSLQMVILAATGVTPQGFRQLRDARRDLTIFFSPDPKQTGITLNGQRTMSDMMSWGLHRVTSSAPTTDLVLLLTTPHDWSTGQWTSAPSLRGLGAIELSGPSAVESLAWLASRVSHLTSIDIPAEAVRQLNQAQLTSLRSARLRNVRSSEDLESLGRMQLLTNLSIEVGSPLEAERLPNLSELPHLRYLTLEGPGVNDAIAEFLLGLATPTSLTLEMTRPSKADALQEMKGWRHLQHVILKGPGVNNSLVGALSQVAGLKRLELDLSSPLGPDALQPVGRLPELADIELRGHGVNDVVVRSLSRLAAPTTLALEVPVPLGPQALQDLGAWRDLERIRLKGAGVNDSLIRALAKITRLRSLHLEIISPMGKGALQPLRVLPYLRFLVLEGPGVTDAMVASLTMLPALESLSLGNAPVSDAGVATFLNLARPPQIRADQTRISQEMIQQLDKARRRR